MHRYTIKYNYYTNYKIKSTSIIYNTYIYIYKYTKDYSTQYIITLIVPITKNM